MFQVRTSVCNLLDYEIIFDQLDFTFRSIFDKLYIKNCYYICVREFGISLSKVTKLTNIY